MQIFVLFSLLIAILAVIFARRTLTRSPFPSCSGATRARLR
jgi:hypothetical protein